MRKVFELSPLKKATSNPEIIAFDTEDNGNGAAPGNLLCATFYSEKEEKIFFSKEEARRYLFMHRKKPVIFFAHNLAYDLANLDYPEGTAKHILARSKLIGARFDYNRKVTRFMDTGNFFAGTSIKELGKIFGDDKLDFDISRIKGKKLEDLDDKTKEEMGIYCLKDSKICWSTATNLLKLANDNNTRFKAYTVASLALRIFRTNFLTCKWPIRQMYINNFERLSYYGGRTEVLHYGEFDTIFYEDIVSSYPRAMFYEQFPVPWLYTRALSPKWEQIKDKFGISLVHVRVPYMRIPPLPYRSPDNGKLIFPYGEWIGVYTHVELNMAERYGCEVVNVLDSLIYGESFNPFRDYINTMFQKKATTKGFERVFYKSMMNNLSGKFGEKNVDTFRIPRENFSICFCDKPRIGDKGTCMFCNGYNIEGKHVNPDDNGWVVISGERRPDQPHVFPCIISHVTAYGRIKLYEDRLRYQDALYCDTDSCISTTDYKTCRGKELGNWELKKMEKFAAKSAKEYNVTDDGEVVEKHKGIPKRHVKIYLCECGKENISLECNCGNRMDEDNLRYKFERPVKWSEAIRRKMAPNKWITMYKKLKYSNDKRDRLPNGDTKPIHIMNILNIETFDDIREYYKSVGVEGCL